MTIELMVDEEDSEMDGWMHSVNHGIKHSWSKTKKGTDDSMTTNTISLLEMDSGGKKARDLFYLVLPVRSSEKAPSTTIFAPTKPLKAPFAP